MAQQNLADFLFTLSEELSNEEKLKENRQLAATIIKNLIVIHDGMQKEWLQMDEKKQNEIKLRILSSLASSVSQVRKAAGSSIAGICKIELPLGKWTDIILSLVNNSFNENMNFRLASLETLGYICEELSSKTINPKDVELILTALIRNLNEDSCDENIAKICLTALNHSIDLADKNFKNPIESNLIFETFFKICSKFVNNQKGSEIFTLIIQCFIEIGTKYYQFIEPYITKISELTTFIISSGNDEKLSILAFEFWCCIGDKEITLQGTPQYKGYVEKYTNALQLILANIKKFSTSDDDDEVNDWNLSKSSAFLLSLIVQMSKKELIDQLIEYVTKNLSSSDWKLKNESLLIFGCLLDSPYKDKIKDILHNSIGGLLKLLSDESSYIRKTVSWVICKVTELYPKLFDRAMLSSVVPTLRISLNDINYVAVNICYCFSNLIKTLGDRDTVKNSNAFSSYFEPLFKDLFTIAYKETSYNKDCNLSLTAFLTISNLIDYSSHDKQDKLEEIMIYVLQAFESTINSTNNFDALKNYDFQSYLANIIHSILNKFLKTFSQENALKIFIIFENSFKQRNGVYDEAILAISSLALNQKGKFDILMIRFLNYLKFSLNKFNEMTLNKVALLATGDISRALGNNFANYSSEIIPILIQILASADVVKNNKIIAINTLGDIAMNITDQFFPFLDPIMKILFSACHLGLEIADEGDEDNQEYLVNLRLNLVESFTSIAFAMKDCNRHKEFATYVPTIFEFLKTIMTEKYQPSNDLIKNAIGFIADMCTCYGKEIKVLVQQSYIFDNITKLKSQNTKKMNEFVNWVEEVFKIVIS